MTQTVSVANLVQASVTEGESDLGAALVNRKWTYCVRPFPHYTARNVFRHDLYASMAGQFQSLLDRGLSETPASDRLARNIKGYDAFALSFPPMLDGPLALFLSKRWHDLLARLVGIKATGDVNGGFHHHKPGSVSGWPHNDLNPGWFVDSPRPDGVNVSNHALCDYYFGQTFKPELQARETVRAVALLFYLNNDQWRPGDGGETGLYLEADQTVGDPTVSMPPVDNSLLLFECTPHSYHAFLRNSRQPRNSLIMWLHRTKAEVEARWGQKQIVHWPEGKL